MTSLLFRIVRNDSRIVPPSQGSRNLRTKRSFRDFLTHRPDVDYPSRETDATFNSPENRTTLTSMETLQPPDQTSARVIEAYCALLDSPGARLRFIRKAVARCQTEGIGAGSRWPLFERFTLHRIVVEELVPLLPSGAPAPLRVRAALVGYRLRVPIYVLGTVAILACAVGLGYGALQIAASLQSTTASASVPAPARTASVEAPVGDLPQYTPEQIWLVEQGPGYEVYSNGARILTDLETEGPPRRYYVFPRTANDPAAAVERSGAPVGIVFHTSQSHIAPFKEEYNDKLQTSSRALLEFVQKHRLYHYVIDRFGRIYRIVRDDAIADHAGNSVWADAESVYLDLSGGYLGVCFEAEWSPDMQLAPDQINEAQIYAGRVLTAMLRGKYSIPDATCVTHALVSVSPASRLIGFHMDWANAFPFAAVGLSDKYAIENAAIAEFGFGHDGQFDRAVGDLWPGIPKAESRLADEASRRAVETAALRRERQERYRRLKTWLGKQQPALAETNGDAPAADARAR